MSRRGLCRWVALLPLAWAWLARADGAFPGSQNLFAPADQAQRFLLSTNFGLVISDDDGQTWRLICEAAEQSPNASYYRVGPGPDHRLLAISPLVGLTLSDDDGCDWAASAPGPRVTDAFMDPADGSHVLAAAISVPPDGGVGQPALYESHTGGASFSATPLFAPPGAANFTGVEIAASTPGVYYVTFEVSPVRPFLAWSSDFGLTWWPTELTGQLGNVTVRILAVDPVDPHTVYLRVISAAGTQDSLAIATDGGNIVNPVFQTSGGQVMTAFLRRSDGALLVSEASLPVGTGTPRSSFISTDHGSSFAPVLPGVSVTAIAERGGTTYLATDNTYDGFAVAAWQPDGGLVPLLQYQGICGLKSCGNVVQACQSFFCVDTAAALSEQHRLGIPATVCGAQPCPVTPDAGSGSSSCGCTREAGSGPWTLLAVAVALLALGIARRRKSSG